MRPHHALILSALLLLTACGSDKTDRTIGGAAVGAGVGAMTDIDTINLGRPWWK